MATKYPYDRHTRERQLEQTYPGLDTTTGVKALLRDYARLYDEAYNSSDFDVLIMYVDLKKAISLAGLSLKQRELLRLVYAEELTQNEASVMTKVDQPNVSTYLTVAARKIANIYGEWAKADDY